MLWRADIAVKAAFDAEASGVRRSLAEAGLTALREVRTIRIYLIDGPFSREQAETIAHSVLLDPVVEEFSVLPAAERTPEDPPGSKSLLIFRKPGVMDPVEASVRKGIADLGLTPENVRTGRKYLLFGVEDEDLIRRAAYRVLANEVIETAEIGERTIAGIALGRPYEFRRVEVPVIGAEIAKLREIGDRMTLSLNAQELRAIQQCFLSLGRNPTDLELETLAQTWSEHCKHKTFTGDILFGKSTINNLLKRTIMRATEELGKPWCVSVFKDNAGIVELDEQTNVCFKVETHNHPSAIEPYGGASTGVGGVIRDCLGCGLGAKPIANTDVFCVGLPDTAAEALPKGTIHPRRVLREVVRGVRDYGNRMGIPTVNGGVFFDPRYTSNPLVYCGTVGILPKNLPPKEAHPGDRIVVVGGRTGRDGIHGATFSSAKLTTESEIVSGGAVQIGDAITEKRTMDAILRARDERLYTCITDCGAGGLSSAVGEMGEKTGAEVDLEKVPLKYDGLTYAEIWISESQERMVLAVPPDRVDRFLALCGEENVEGTVIGTFTNDRRLHARYRGETVGMLDMEFLHHGVPRTVKSAVWSPRIGRDPALKNRMSLGKELHAILASLNVASKEWIVRQYDHEVQAGTVVKPFVGDHHDGPSDAAVIRPRPRSNHGIALAIGMNPRFGDVDPYHMAASAIDEAIRNVVAVGGDPERTALLDNFCWGDPNDAETLGALVRAATACYDTAVAYGTPFISGKDSFYNTYHVGDRVLSIPYSLLISAMSRIEDVGQCVTMDAKLLGDLVYVVGMTKREMGGSHLFQLYGETGFTVPQVDAVLGKKVFAAMHRAIREGNVRSCHDCSEGGLVVALAEMAFAGDLGMEISLEGVPVALDLDDPGDILFSESNSRFVVCVRSPQKTQFENALRGVPFGFVGEVTNDRLLIVRDRNGKEIVREEVAALKKSWQKWSKSEEYQTGPRI